MLCVYCRVHFIDGLCLVFWPPCTLPHHFVCVGWILLHTWAWHRLVRFLRSERRYVWCYCYSHVLCVLFLGVLLRLVPMLRTQFTIPKLFPQSHFTLTYCCYFYPKTLGILHPLALTFLYSLPPRLLAIIFPISHFTIECK